MGRRAAPGHGGFHRRRFIAAAGAWSTLAWTGALAQSKPPVVIGWLASPSRRTNEKEFGEFKKGLAALGWKEPQIGVEERWADGHYDRLPALVQELVARKPALIVTQGGQATAAAAKGAPGTPIVMAQSSDPVAAGFAASLARPGGMITGVTNLTESQEKLLELLLAAVPGLKRVGFLAQTTNVNYATQIKGAREAVSRHKIEGHFADVARPDQIEAAVSRLGGEGAQALIVLSSSLFTTERQRIVSLAAARRWPVICGHLEFIEAGALLTYGFDVLSNFRRAAYYVDRILKGARPGDLPIEQPTKLELVVNMKTAKALGLTIPQPFLMRADRVIE